MAAKQHYCSVSRDAGEDSRVPHLSNVHYQVTGVGYDNVPIHLVRLHDDSLFSFGLLLPGDVRLRVSDHVAVDAYRSIPVKYLLLRAGVEHRREGLGVGGGGRGFSHGVLWQRAGVWTRQVITAGDHIHVAAVEVREAVGGGGEAGLTLAAVLTFTHWLPLPHVTHRPLLAAHKPITASHTPRRNSRPRLTVIGGAVRDTGRHAAQQATHISTALLKGSAIL